MEEPSADLEDACPDLRLGKQDAGRGCAGVKGFNAYSQVISTPLVAPVIVTARPRQEIHELRAKRGESPD